MVMNKSAAVCCKNCQIEDQYAAAIISLKMKAYCFYKLCNKRALSRESSFVPAVKYWGSVACYVLQKTEKNKGLNTPTQSFQSKKNIYIYFYKRSQQKANSMTSGSTMVIIP